ncbi:hypothetical protein ACFY0N_14205 [Streptomyces vinaceus]|uniref:hypothetical protein n=1 Tax=Streptomyces vinaceus TaxID=1960 RepID=UPI00367D937A
MAGITAASSLIAAAITALIAYLIAKRNLAHAADMAALERAARLAEQDRTQRRDAYAAYVTAAMSSFRDSSMLRVTDFASAESWQEAAVAARDVYNSLVVAQGIVKMEAPESLAAHAESLRQAAMEYRLSVVASVKPGLNDAKRKELQKDREEKWAVAFKGLSTFTDAARTDLKQ